MTLAPILLPWTVWRFTSPSSGEQVVIAKPTEPREYEHEYQQVVARVEAYTASQAVLAAGGQGAS